MNNQEATVEEAVAAAAAERETDEDELEEVVGDTDAISAIGTSQLLFDIVTEEENHDLITLVKRVEENVVFDCAIDDDIKWSVDHETKIIDFLQDSEKETLFISVAAGLVQVAFHLAEIDFGAADAPPSMLSYLVKALDPHCLITPHNWYRAVHQQSLDPLQLAPLFTQMTQHIQQLSTPYKNEWTEFHHLLELNMLKQRLLYAQCADEAELVRPIFCCLQSGTDDAENEDTIELFEKLVSQWISVVNYNVTLRDYGQPKGDVPFIKDEVHSQTLRRDVLAKLCHQLQQEDCQRVKDVLRKADSVIGDEFDELHTTLNREYERAKVTVKYLSCLERPLDMLDRIKITHLSDVVPSYREILNRIFIVLKHAAYQNRESAAGRLLFMAGNQIVAKCRTPADEAVNHLIKGNLRQCVSGILRCRRTLRDCIQTYHQVKEWQELELNLDDEIILSNINAMDLRIGHLIDICHSLDQLGRLGDDNHLAITFSVERDSDIGQSLRQSQDKFVSICHTLLNDHKDDIFDVYHPHSWYQPYSRFQNEREAIEIRLVYALELAVSKCGTLSTICDVLVAFQHLYPRPTVATVIDSIANQLFKKAAQEAKKASSIDFSDVWKTPVISTLTSRSARMAASAQRARGNVDKIAKLMDSVSWAGSPAFQEKCLQRCQQGHRLLTDVIRKQFNEWCLKLQEEVLYNTNAALHKFVIRRHIDRPDWIQPNLDSLVLDTISATGEWDRLLIELPHSVVPLLQERLDILNLHGSLTTFCYHYNSVIKGLSVTDRENYRSNVVKLEKTVQVGLNKITWKQCLLIRKFIINGYIVIEELIQVMKDTPDDESEY